MLLLLPIHTVRPHTPTTPVLGEAFTSGYFEIDQRTSSGWENGIWQESSQRAVGLLYHYQIWLLAVVPFSNQLILSMKNLKFTSKQMRNKLLLSWHFLCCVFHMLIFYIFGLLSSIIEFVFHLPFYISDKT